MYDLYENISYTLEELQEITKIERLDSIERSLKHYGYEYIKEGKGKKSIITITKTPNDFKTWALKNGFNKETDFDKLLSFLKIIYNHPSLLTNPLTQLTNILNKNYNLDIHYKTVLCYITKLINLEIININCTKNIYMKDLGKENPWIICETEKYKEFFQYYYENGKNFKDAIFTFNKIFLIQNNKELNIFNIKEDLKQWLKE